MRASQPIRAQADGLPRTAAYGRGHQDPAGTTRSLEDQAPMDAEEQGAEQGKPKSRPPRPLSELLTYEEYEEIPFTD